MPPKWSKEVKIDLPRSTLNEGSECLAYTLRVVRAVARPWRERRLPRAPIFRERIKKPKKYYFKLKITARLLN